MEGLLKSTKEHQNKLPDLMTLWAHEYKRTFEDRFINDEDI